MNVTSVFEKNLSAYNKKYRYIVNKGSTRSSKTYSILQLLYLIAQFSKKQLIISIVSESIPHLKKGCIRDFTEIVKKDRNWSKNNWNATDYIYRINNSIIEFFSADSAGKVHGPSRNILYVNECINIDYEVYRQLAIRTTETIFLDCNPNFEFWLDEKIIPRKNEAILIHSTYKDNRYLTEAQLKEIESNRTDTNWWRVYGEGKTGSLRGSVVQDWEIVDSFPENYKSRWIGIDFGFTNDPTAIVDIRLSEGELWIDEILYERGCDNIMIANTLKNNNITTNICIIADSAEPKSIQEIRSFGFRIEAAQKGRDSINNGIEILNRYRKNISRRSVNIINEYRNYRWQMDIFGEPTNTPIDRYNHSIDAQRYVCLNKLKQQSEILNYSVIRGKQL